jgi:hypothetical protein
MPTKRPRFTLEQHRALGRVLRALEEELKPRVTQVLNHYPKNSGEAHSMESLLESLRRARHKMLEALLNEHPNSDENLNAFYFPPTRDEG